MKNYWKLPITFDEFMKGYLRWRVNFDRAFWFQCVDLIRQYWMECFNIILPASWWSAKKWRFQNRWKYKKITNTPEWFPEKWDIIFFDSVPSNPYWHVWIVTWWWALRAMVLDQNWWVWTATWRWKDSIQVREFNYINPPCLWRIRLTLDT